jgi:hypothetical protein
MSLTVREGRVAMLNFHCHRMRLAPGSRPAMEAWAASLNAREAEVRQTLVAEGVELELVLLEEDEAGDHLIFVLRTDDYARALEVFAASTAPIDELHRAFLEATVVERTPLRVLVATAASG